VLGLGFLWRFHTGRWKTMRVIEEQEALDPEEEILESV